MGTKVYNLPGLRSYSGALNFDEGEQTDRTPTGPASGDLGANYPGPSVVALHAGTQRLDLGDIADGQLMKRAGLTVVGVAPSTLSGSAGNNFLSPPAVADPMDDEFRDGSSDFAARGWQVTNALTGAAMTRVGDVTQAAPGLSATQYRSTLTPSGMLVQSAAQIIVVKAWAGGTSGALYCHASLTVMPSTTTFFEAPQLWMPLTFGDPPLQANSNRKLFINNYPVPSNGRVFSRMDLNQAYTTLGSYSYNTDSFPWGGWVSWDSGGKLAAGAIFNPYGERVLMDVSGQSWPAFFPLWAGFALITANAANTWATVRCFRKLALGKWPGIA